jgi:uncharacterized membrane protein
VFTNVFKRVNIESLIASFFLCVLANVFMTYCVTAGNIDTQALVKTMCLSLAYISIILTIAFSESRRLNQSFGSIHLLSIPICILLFNQQGGFVLDKAIVLAVFLRVITLFSKDYKTTPPTKALFLLGVLFTIISFINSYYALFFITPLLILKEAKHRNTKNILALLLGIILSLQSLCLICYLATGSFFYKTMYLKASVSGSYSSNDLVWSVTVFIALLTATVFRPAEYKRKAQRNNTQRTFLFMQTFLLISIFLRYYNEVEEKGLWLESFIPVAFFIGIAIDALKKRQLKNTIITVVIFASIGLKLFAYDLISF